MAESSDKLTARVGRSARVIKQGGRRVSSDEPSSATDDEETEGASGEYQLDRQIGFILRRAHQRATAIFQEHFPDLTPTQWAVLVKLRDAGPTSQNLLGRMVAMDAATMQGVVRRLLERGLVARFDDPADRRRLTLSLTAVGEAAVVGQAESALAVSRETLSPLSPRDRETLLRLLSRII